MKAPFDLQKALDGHKLITRDGNEVKNFRLAPHYSHSFFPYSAEVNVEKNWIDMCFTKSGGYNDYKEDRRDLFLEVNQIIPKDALNPIPDDLPEIPEGFVFMGKGGEFKYEGEKENFGYINRKVDRQWHFNSIPFTCCCNKQGYYIFPADSKTVKLNLELKQNMKQEKTFEEKIEEAQKLIGKRVKWDSMFITVSDIQVILKGQSSSIVVDEYAIKHGYCIAVLSENKTNTVPYDECTVVTDIVINGHRADFSKVKTEKVVIFGCAKINIEIFEGLNNLFSNTNTGNRFLQSPVKIGAGTFQDSDIINIYQRIQMEK